MTVSLRSIPLPEFDIPIQMPEIPASEYLGRTDALYRRAGVSWVAVYGDREHNANLLYFTGFDPRFEEAMLLLGPGDRRFLLVGNEGMIHVQDAGLAAEHVLYQPFSLMAQPRGTSAPLPELLANLGMTGGQTVGVVGWKYFEDEEQAEPAYVPTFIVRAFATASGAPPRDITELVMSPEDGERTTVSAAEIARMEWGAARASAAVMRVVSGSRPGMTELEAFALSEYQGEPLQCHSILSSSSGTLNGLRSPRARVLGEGDAVSCGIGYWGGLCCRAGLLTDDVDDAFLASFVTPYFSALAAWWQSLSIGRQGGEMYGAVISALGDASFQPMLNPGHLGSYDEWVHSPIHENSTLPLRSGMVLQCDIIPTPLPPGRALNCEDTVALADESLRAELQVRNPRLWSRIEARRAFMMDQIGLNLAPEVLPLSHSPVHLAPFWLRNDLVCVNE